jgi:hypothetical protein
MDFGDYSPLSLPSREMQEDALQKGLGRAWQWAVNGRLDDDILMQSCQRDLRFDQDCEDARGEWMWRIVGTAGATQRFRVPILHALYELSDKRSAHQLCELARFFAETGDEAFRSRLYEIVEQKPFADRPWLGEEQIVALDGEQAFLFAAAVRGRRLEGREWECDDGSLMDQAIDRFGEQQIRNLLDTSSNPALGTFRKKWQQDKQKKANKKQALSHRERMESIPVDQVLKEAESTTACGWFRGWGMYAEEADLKTVLQRLWTVQEPRVISNLVRVFTGRALPEFDARLIQLCLHVDEQVQQLAFGALERNSHPIVREFALSQLQQGEFNSSVVGLLTENYRPGDEQLILEGIEIPNDPCNLHWLLWNVIGVLKKNPKADGSRLGVIAYALTPCATCRFNAAKLLLQQQAAPGWLMEECRYDCGEDCRKLFEGTEVS